jgi:DNA polymerase-3 subunit gamma/tau
VDPCARRVAARRVIGVRRLAFPLAHDHLTPNSSPLVARLMHVALARKYRPRAFADLVGQEHVARGLRGAIAQNRVAHGYLLCGPRGVGKTTAARILAMALNCETRHAGKGAESGEPCGTCASCERIWAGGASLDVVEIDAASNRGVDDARDLRERAMYAASQEGRHKVYIVDEAHMLTREAWNTLLKVLEEPPPGVVFVFATTEPGKISNTAAPVMSRLQRFDFRRVGPEAIAERVTQVARAESLEVAPDAVELIARVANGGLRDALSVLDQVTAFGGGAITAARLRDVLGLVSDEVFEDLLAIVLQRRAADVFPFVAKLVEAGVDLVAFAEGAGDLWRAALAAALGAKPDGVSSALAAHIQEAGRDLVPGDVVRILRSLEESEESVRRGSNPRLVLETLIARWVMMDRTVDIAELLRGRGTEDGGQGEARREERGVRSAAPSPSVPRVVRDAAAAAPVRESGRGPAAEASTHGTQPGGPAPAGGAQGQLTLEGARAAWPAILDALRADRKMIVAQALQEAEVAAVDGSMLRLRPLTANPLVAETVQGKRAMIAAAAARVLGAGVDVALYEDAPSPPPPGDEPATDLGPSVTGPPATGPSVTPSASEPGPPRKSPRITTAGARAERARALRGRDPALDSAMDVLDLELLD